MEVGVNLKWIREYRDKFSPTLRSIWIIWRLKGCRKFCVLREGMKSLQDCLATYEISYPTMSCISDRSNGEKLTFP